MQTQLSLAARTKDITTGWKNPDKGTSWNSSLKEVPSKMTKKAEPV